MLESKSWAGEEMVFPGVGFLVGRAGKLLIQNRAKSPFMKICFEGWLRIFSSLVAPSRISSVNTMERRASCLKKKSKSSWSYGRSVSLGLQSPELLVGGATFCPEGLLILCPNCTLILVSWGVGFPC